MKFTFELNGVRVPREIPTDWDQVTFGDFLKLGEANKEAKALSVFTGIDEETLRKANITGLNKLIAALSFLRFDVPMTQFPKTLAGKPVNNNLEFEPFGVYTDIKDIVEGGKQGIELLRQFPLMCAIYITKPYDFKEAEKLSEELLKSPCTEVLALGNFLLMKLIALNSTISKTSLKRLTPLRRLRLALNGWRARLAFRVRYFIFNRFHLTTKKTTS